MAGSDILTSTLDLVSQSLQIPVIIFLLLFAVAAVVLLGGLIREFRHRKTISNAEMKNLISGISNAGSESEMLNIIENSEIPNSQKNDLEEIISTWTLNPEPHLQRRWSAAGRRNLRSVSPIPT